MRLELYDLSEKQRRFLMDRHKYLAFGGARGGGKSHAVRISAVVLALRYPGIRIMIVRKTYPELQNNHITPLIELLHCFSPIKEERAARYNDQKKELAFPNGSRIFFRYLENDRDAMRFQGLETDVLFVDEATQQTEERMKKLTACVRGVNDFPKLIRYTCNPGGEGHAWVKRLFIDRHYKDNEKPEDYAFIQSLVQDNLALMKTNPDYIAQLEALPPRLRAAWLDGNWDIYEGQVFEDFCLEPDTQEAKEHGCTLPVEELRARGRWCHVIEPFDIGSGERTGWNILRSFDWGYNKPFSVGWWAIDYDGVMYRILELYGCTDTPNEGVRWSKEQVFGKIAEIEREHPWLRGRNIEGVADPAIFSADGGESIAETAARFGVYFRRGDNSRIPGWMQCHYRLQFDENGYARMYVFSTCKDFLRTIPLLLYDEHHPEDIDTDMEDHAADEWRYAMMARPIMPRRKAAKKEIFFDPLDQMKRRRD